MELFELLHYFRDCYFFFRSVVDEYRRSHNSFLLGDVTVRPGILEKDDNFNGLARGLVTEHELELDQYHDRQVIEMRIQSYL